MYISPSGNDHLPTWWRPSHHAEMTIFTRGDDHLPTWWWSSHHAVMTIFPRGDDHFPTWWWASSHLVMTIFPRGDDYLITRLFLCMVNGFLLTRGLFLLFSTFIVGSLVHVLSLFSHCWPQSLHFLHQIVSSMGIVWLKTPIWSSGWHAIAFSNIKSISRRYSYRKFKF